MTLLIHTYKRSHGFFLFFCLTGHIYGVTEAYIQQKPSWAVGPSLSLVILALLHLSLMGQEG